MSTAISIHLLAPFMTVLGPWFYLLGWLSSPIGSINGSGACSSGISCTSRMICYCCGSRARAISIGDESHYSFLDGIL